MAFIVGIMFLAFFVDHVLGGRVVGAW